MKSAFRIFAFHCNVLPWLMIPRVSPMRIDSYRFGRMVVGGEAHTRDVVVFSDRVVPGWRRKEGHSLSPEDLAGIVAPSPKILVVGTGAIGMMRVPSETEEFLAAKGIRIVAMRTGAAVEEYNRHADDPEVAGAFHLTC